VIALQCETGLYQYNHRYYSPTLGRFISRDPTQENGGLNLYAYCGNDPIGHWDYLGQSWLSKAFKKIGRWFKKNVVSIIGVALNFVPGIGPALSMAWNAGVGLKYGGIKGLLMGVAGSLVGGKIGNYGLNIGGRIGGAVSGALHFGSGTFGSAVINGYFTGGVSGGLTASLSGQNFWGGFRAGAITGGVLAGGIYAGTHPGWAQSLSNKVRAFPGIVGAPLGGMIDAFGGMTEIVGGVFTLNMNTMLGGFKNTGLGILSSVGLKEVFTEPWIGRTELYQRHGLRMTGDTRLPESLAVEVGNAEANSPIPAQELALNGMHGWHAGTNASLAGRLGIFAAPIQWLGGLWHEVDPSAVSAELAAQVQSTPSSIPSVTSSRTRLGLSQAIYCRGARPTKLRSALVITFRGQAIRIP